MAARASATPKKNEAKAVPEIEKTGSILSDPIALEERIRVRAYEIYLQHGAQDGAALDDWLQAEAEIKGEAH